MPRRWTVTAVCLLLSATTACGGDAAGDATEGAATADSSLPSDRTVAAPAFGEEYVFPDGLAVVVSEPKPFTPSRTAYPEAAHAVGFEIVIRNGSDRPYRLSGLSVTATADGEPSREIVDTTQGYHGIGASTDLGVSRKVRLRLAFTADTEPTDLALHFQPDPNRPYTVHFADRA